MRGAVRTGAVVVWLANLAAGCGESPCVQQVEREKACGLVRDDDIAVCRDPEVACAIECYVDLSCKQMTAIFIDDAPYPLGVTRCLWACQQGFACDGNPGNTAIRECNGFIECLDGSDEQGCSYFECDDGQLVSEDARCDDYDECMDGSDEDDC